MPNSILLNADAARFIVSPELIVSLYHVHQLRPCRGNTAVINGRCCALGVLRKLMPNVGSDYTMPWSYTCGLTAGFDGLAEYANSKVHKAGYANGVAIRAACIVEFGNF